MKGSIWIDGKIWSWCQLCFLDPSPQMCLYKCHPLWLFHIISRDPTGAVPSPLLPWQPNHCLSLWDPSPYLEASKMQKQNISDLTFTIPIILSFLDHFSSISGYKSNLNKRECFPINAAVLLLDHKDLVFKLSKSGFKYLGINVKLTALFPASFTPLISTIKSDFQKWSNLPHSMIGKINTIKMNVLPRILNIF